MPPSTREFAIRLSSIDQLFERLVAHGEIRTEPRSWLAAHMRQRAAMYLIVGDIVLPLEPFDVAGARTRDAGRGTRAGELARRRDPSALPRRFHSMIRDMNLR